MIRTGPSERDPPVVAERPDSDAELGWRWIDQRPAAAVGRPWDPHPYVASRGGVQLDVEQGDDLAIRRNDAVNWTVRFDGHPNRARVSIGEDAVYVVYFHHMSSGARVAKLALGDGRIVYDHPLQGLGPISHSKYINDVQLERRPDVLEVHGWESAGGYVEVIDPGSGHAISRAVVPDELATLRWRWQGNPDAFRYREPVFELRDFGVVRVLAEAVELPDGKRVPLESGFASSRPAAAAIVDGGTLYVAYGESHSSGARLMAIDIQGGDVRWDSSLRGIGPTAHSEYFNQLQIAKRHGHVVVYGNESNGRYLEAVDAGGVSRVTKCWQP